MLVVVFTLAGKLVTGSDFLICDWIYENHPYRHKKWNPIYCWLLTYTLALPKNTKHIAIDSQVCFHWRLIANPVKPPWCNTGSVGPVYGTNTDVTGARLLPTTVSTCPVDWVPFCQSLKTQHCCMCPYGSFNLPPATHPPLHPPHPLPPTHPLYHAIPDITVAVKKVAEKPAVLAS